MRYILFFMMLFSVVSITAQRNPPVFDHYGPEQGLNTRTTGSIVKTKDGMIWIGTGDGLVRFDSKAFTFYRHDPSDTTSIADNGTFQMVLDNNGIIWISTGRGLDAFNPETGIFTHISLQNDGKVISDFFISALYNDNATNTLWIFANNGNGLYRNQNGGMVFNKATVDIEAVAILKGSNFFSITKDLQNHLWLGNADGFYQYFPTTGVLIQHHVPMQNDAIKNDDGVISMYFDAKGILWIGTWLLGLVRYDTETGKGDHFFYSDYTKSQNGVLTITQTKLPQQQNILWISAVYSGFTSFNMDTKQFTSYESKSTTDKFGIKGQITGMLTTNNEGMWIGGDEGLHRYDYNKQLFTNFNLANFKPVFSKSFGIEGFNIQKSANLKDSICWFTIPYLGGFIYNMVLNKMSKLPAELATYLDKSVTFFSSYLSTDNVLWLGTSPYGVLAYNIVTKEILLKDNTTFNATVGWAYQFFEDRKKQMWVGGLRGLFIADASTTHLVPVTEVNDALSKASISTFIVSMDDDEEGNIWFVTGRQHANESYTIGSYNIANRTVRVFTYTNSQKLGFPEGAVLRTIVCGANGKIFVATQDGLMHFNSKLTNPTFQMLTTKDGLLNNGLTHIVQDAKGLIWGACVLGICSYNPNNNVFTNYTSAAYSLGSKKYPGLYVSPNTGHIYISQQDGFDVLQTGNSTKLDTPLVRFTALQIFNKPYLQYGVQLQNGQTVALDYQQNMLSVSFVTTSYTNAAENQYAYMLQGLEREWNYTKNNIATYTNLAPGTYYLLVKAANNRGVWSEKPISLTIMIAPPFYKRWWFIVLCILAVAALIFYMMQLRINRIKERFALRNKIANDLHDEIGSTLTSISILSNVSQVAMEKEPLQAMAMLQQIAMQSKAVQQNMSDIVWAIRPDNEKIENLMVRMREYAAQTLEPLNIQTAILFDEALLHKVLPIECRKEVLLIFKEALNNIAKHSCANLVKITLQQTNESLELQICDNGKWTGSESSSGTGMRSMQQRAETIGGKLITASNASGFSVVLCLPLT